MISRWGAERVLALAPDASSVSAGRKLAGGAPWSTVGVTDSPALVWGECRGSGATPYRTAVDLADVAYSCSCPSRKFPCKHALGLLLLWSAGSVPAADAPADWAAGWLDARRARADRVSGRPVPAGAAQAAGPSGPTGPAAGPGAVADRRAAARRGVRRAERMAAGLAELDLWLHDQVRAGLAGLERAGYRPFDAVAARLVDAQLPGAATRVRELPGVAASGPGWPQRMLAELASLHLLCSAWQRLPELPPELATAVRVHAGLPTARDDVLAGPPERDHWLVLGLRDQPQERLISRRVWLRGERTGRTALVLSYGAAGQGLDASLPPGRRLDADLHRYPGQPLRALVGVRHGPADPTDPAAVPGVPAGVPVDAALAGFAAGLAVDPWTRAWPALLGEVVPVRAGDDGWLLVDAAGDCLRLLPGTDPWVLVAASGGGPLTVFGELGAGGFRPLSLFDSGELVTL